MGGNVQISDVRMKNDLQISDVQNSNEQAEIFTKKKTSVEKNL